MMREYVQKIMFPWCSILWTEQSGTELKESPTTMLTILKHASKEYKWNLKFKEITKSKHITEIRWKKYFSCENPLLSGNECNEKMHEKEDSYWQLLNNLKIKYSKVHCYLHTNYFWNNNKHSSCLELWMVEVGFLGKEF